MKVCKNCGQPLDEPRSVLPKVGLQDIGRAIYFEILDGAFKSVELCNFCHVVMNCFRETLTKGERDGYESTIVVEGRGK